MVRWCLEVVVTTTTTFLLIVITHNMGKLITQFQINIGVGRSRPITIAPMSSNNINCRMLLQLLMLIIFNVEIENKKNTFIGRKGYATLEIFAVCVFNTRFTFTWTDIGRWITQFRIITEARTRREFNISYI